MVQHISKSQVYSESLHHQAHLMEFLYSKHPWANLIGFCLLVWTVSNIASHKNTNAKITYHNKLKKLYEELSNNQNIILITSNTSVRNNIAILVSHIWREHEIIAKTIHYTMNVLFMKAKLFAIRYRICFIIIDTIYAAKYIFNLSIHPYKLYSIIIFSNLRKFFNKNNNNFISFWNCPSNDK